MAGDHHSPAAAYGSPSHSPIPSETLISHQSTQNDVTPAAHNQQSGIKLPSNRRRSNRKIQTLINAVNLIPFTPKLLVLHKHENVLKRLGLYNFSKIKLDQNIRSDLIAQVIGNYDPKKRCSHVSGKRVRVSRADLARALELPVTKQDINNINNNNLGVFSAEEIEFVDDFVFNWMLIHEESWVMPEKMVRMTQCVRDGHPEKLDSASLIWYKVERELCLGVKLVDCYYASHLQRLIRSQCEQLFEADDEVKEHIEKVSDELTLEPNVELTLAHETVDELVDSENNTGEQLLQHCQTSDLNNNEVKVEEDEDDGEHIEKASIVKEDAVELTLGDVTMDVQVDLKNNMGEQLLQRCQASDLNNNEVKVEEDEDDGEHIEKVSIIQEDAAELTLGDVTMDEQVDLNNNLGGRLLQRCQASDLNNNEEVKVEEDGEHIEKVSVVQEDAAELTLGDVTMDEQVDLNNNLGEQLLQHCQASDLNNNEEVMVEEDGEHIEKVSVVQEDAAELTLGDVTMDEQVDLNNNLGEKLLQHCQAGDLNNNEEVKVEEDGEHIEKVSIVQEDAAELTLGDVTMDEQVDLNNNLGEQLLQCCQASDLNNNEEVKVEEDGEHIEKVSVVQEDAAEFTLGDATMDEQVDLNNNLDEQLLQHCQASDLNNNNEVMVVNEQIVEVDDGEVKEDEDDGEHIEKVSIVREDAAELSLGDVIMDEQVDLNNNLGEQLLQRCQASGLSNNEEVKFEDEQIVEVEDGEVKEDEDDGEHKEKASIVREDAAELTLGDVTMDEQVDLNNNLAEQLLQRCQASGLINNEEVKVEDEQIVEVEDGEGKEDEDDGEHIEKVSIFQEDDVELTLAHDVELTLGHETVDELVDSKNNPGEKFLQHCQTSDLNYNEVNVEDVVDEPIVQVEGENDDGEKFVEGLDMEANDDAIDLSGSRDDSFMSHGGPSFINNNSNSNLGERFLQRCQSSDMNIDNNNNINEVKVGDDVDEQIVQVEEENDDDEGEKFVEGFDMEANDDAINLSGSRDDSSMSHGGPSFFDSNNNGKRVMQSEDDTHHLVMNNKRLKTNDIWDHKQSEFGLCMLQMDQWIEKAKMITDSKEQIYVNHKYHQDLAMNELQDRQQVMEMIIKSKDEELGQKHAEVYRLEHELYLMMDLLSGYRTALNDERIKFSEYRKRVGVQEKPALMDVGPGGLALSTRVLEEVVSNDADVSEEKGGGEEH